MIVFQQSFDKIGTITWLPDQTVQERLATTPPETLVALEALIGEPLHSLSAILTGALKYNPHAEEVIDDLNRGLIEVAQRALLRLDS